MNEVNDTLNYFTTNEFYYSLLVVVVTLVILRVIKQYLIKKVAYTSKDEQHTNTFIGVIFSVLQYMVVAVAVVIVLRINDVNIVGIFTGLGIVATIIGLALQDTLKDIIAGINIYNNNFYKVGDMVKYNGEECDVKYFSARITKFQSVITNSTYTVCNSQITSIEKIKDVRTRLFSFKFEEDKEKVLGALKAVAEKMKDVPNYKETVMTGIVSISTLGVDYAFVYKCPAHKYLIVDQIVVDTAFDEFKKAGVSPVFNRDFFLDQ